MRILVGTLATIENEFDACTASIQRQTHRDFEQFVIRDLPNKQAHDTLYRTFMSRAEAFDLLIKVDADMVLTDDRFFEKVVERFQEHTFKETNPPTQLGTKTTGQTTKTRPTYPPPPVLPVHPAPASAPSIMNALIISVHDWFSDRLIEGLHVYRSDVRWEANDERVFVDRACLPANQIVYDRTTLAPAAYHCPDPSPFQAFHYGLHKGVKVLAAIRGHRRATAEFHITNIEQTWRHFLRQGDRRLALACLGAELALAGWFEARHVDVQDNHVRDVLRDYEDLNADALRHVVKKRRRRNAAWLSPMVRAEWLAVGPLRFIGRRIVPVKWHSQIGRWIHRVNSPPESSPESPPKKTSETYPKKPAERFSEKLIDELPGQLPGLSISSGTEPVTWLLPVKDAMPYLRHSLESIANQTYPHHRLIAWDNGSTDDSVEELRRWVPDKIPGVVVTDRPMGLGACLAAMVDLAPTELCARIDGDDVNDLHRLARQVEFLTDHPSVGIVGSDIQFIDTLGRETHGAWTVQTRDADIRWRLRFCNAMNHPTVMFRRSVVLAAGNYRDLKPGQDYDLWLRLISRTTMANLPQILVQYRVHERSVGATHRGESALVNRRIASQHATKIFPGLSHELAMRVGDLGLFDSNIAVSVRDCLLFRRAATLAAGRQWLPPYYYRDTELFKSQYRRLLAKLLLRRVQEKKPTTLLKKHNSPSELRRAG